jgi:Zn-finger nucleic acid-binding protein
MNCPTCNVTLLITNREGIEIDYCPQCRGVWLDRGELDKIIERSAAYEKQWFRDDDDDDDRYQAHYGYKKRKKSFLSDLLDIG